MAEKAFSLKMKELPEGDLSFGYFGLEGWIPCFDQEIAFNLDA